MTDYAGFANQETFNVTVAFDAAGELRDHVYEYLAWDELPFDADNLQAAVADYLEPRGNGYGRHALMDVIEMLRLIGSLWRVDWVQVAEYLTTKGVVL